MQTLDLSKFCDLIDDKIKKNKAEIEICIQKEWYEKASELNLKNLGLVSARLIATSGECHTK